MYKAPIHKYSSLFSNKKGLPAAPLRICLLTYRGAPTCGGQGIYIRYLSRALKNIGHEVEVVSGPPYPELDDDIALHRLPGMDLYNPDHLFKIRRFRALAHPVNLLEWLGVFSKGFPEPLTFGFRAYKFLSNNSASYDVIHDNQSLSYGLLGLKLRGLPTVATIHHPISIDKEIELESTKSIVEKLKIHRWYTFLGMQGRVARKLSHIITVSECAKLDISKAFHVSQANLRTVFNGIDTHFFRPLPHIQRFKENIIVTNSADSPLKGLKHLLEAVAAIRKKRRLSLTIIGKPKKEGMIQELIKAKGIGDIVKFTGRIETEEFASYYAQTTMAVIPSIYEGFGLPAAEAMACGVPVVSTTGGALPEVVGDAGLLIPPADSKALETAILSLLDDPAKRERLGKAGRERVLKQFSWEHTAEETVKVYQEAIDAHR